MRPSYKTNDPKGWCGDIKRGAAMGRSSIQGDPNFSGKVFLCRIYLDNGGYDCNGTYFGSGEPLYWYSSEDGSIDRMLRASSREDAKRQVRELYPCAKFFR